MPARRKGAGRGDPRHAGLGIRTPTISRLVTSRQVVEGGRDEVYDLLSGASLEGQPDGIVEKGRNTLYDLLTSAIPEVA